MKRFVLPCCLLAATSIAAGLAARPGSTESRPSPAAAQAAFDALKALEGSWAMCDEDGAPTDQIGSVYHVTAGGSAVMETMFPGAEHEMLTVYYIESDTLKMTHYCMLGNRPVLTCSQAEIGAMVFECNDTECCGDEMHMHAATFDLTGRDRITTTWCSNDAGEDAEHEVRFELVRVDATR